jgi:hypothetical protein
MGDEQRVFWQELLAQSRDDLEAGTDFASYTARTKHLVPGVW